MRRQVYRPYGLRSACFDLSTGKPGKDPSRQTRNSKPTTCNFFCLVLATCAVTMARGRHLQAIFDNFSS